MLLHASFQINATVSIYFKSFHTNNNISWLLFFVDELQLKFKQVCNDLNNNNYNCDHIPLSGTTCPECLVEILCSPLTLTLCSVLSMALSSASISIGSVEDPVICSLR